MATKPKRRPGTVAAVNRAIDAMNRKANPPKKRAVAKTRLVQRKANPGKVSIKKAAPAFGNIPWHVITAAGFRVASFDSKKRAVEYAQQYADKENESVQVLRREFKHWEL